jgi:hypothetical protein
VPVVLDDRPAVGQPRAIAPRRCRWLDPLSTALAPLRYASYPAHRLAPSTRTKPSAASRPDHRSHQSRSQVFAARRTPVALDDQREGGRRGPQPRTRCRRAAHGARRSAQARRAPPSAETRTAADVCWFARR